jgi:outer membrane protein assembly factor BamB
LAIAGGRVYTLDYDGKSQERVLCLNGQDGTEIWSYAYQANSKTGGYVGPRATPAVFDGRVYTVGADGLLLCLDQNPPDKNGKLIWQHDLLHEFGGSMPGHGFACSPLVEGNLVIVFPGAKDASVAAFDRYDGTLVWKSMSDPAGYSSPVAADVAGIRQIICFTGLGVAGLQVTDGKQLWHFDWPTASFVNAATPIAVGDYVFISSGYHTGCALLHIVGHPGDLSIEPVYVKHRKLMRNHHMTCVLHDGFLYGDDDNGRNSLKCVDIRTGQERWASDKLGKHTLIYADGHLIALNEDGDLMLVEATPSGYHEHGRMKTICQGPQCLSLPALAGGRLYLRDHHHVTCLDLNVPSASLR